MSGDLSQYKQGLNDGYDYAMHIMQMFADADNPALQEIGSVALTTLRNLREGFIYSALALKAHKEKNNG